CHKALYSGYPSPLGLGSPAALSSPGWRSPPSCEYEALRRLKDRSRDGSFMQASWSAEVTTNSSSGSHLTEPPLFGQGRK
ncbi:unnamed protein product, partial [Symbiodinium pilosum]